MDRLPHVTEDAATRQALADLRHSGNPAHCFCHRWLWRDSTLEDRTAMLRGDAACDEPNDGGDQRAGASAAADWVAVEPWIALPKLRTLRP